VTNHVHSSGVSWEAVFGGAVVTAALSLILLALGTGFGLASVSPWSNAGASAATIGMAAIVWLIFMQIVSSSMGGYLAGRFRTKWVGIHSDEVYFRDTAHGFLSWAVALVATAAFLTSAAARMAGTADSIGAPTTVQAGVHEFEGSAYFVDLLFRSDSAKPDAIGAAARGEAARILARSLRQREIQLADKNYLAQLVATNTGLSRPAADGRISDVFIQAQEAADAARKAVEHVLLWGFLALLVGAFCASLAATIGGRQRDQVLVV
jgi:hypothetical protein